MKVMKQDKLKMKSVPCVPWLKYESEKDDE